ncbi:protein rtcB [Escherichia coli]|nr:protein rtcB [Escherichia coli]
MNYELLTTENAPVKMWTKGVPVEADARQQLINTATMPFIFKHIAVMPDVHLGKGSTIGSVGNDSNLLIVFYVQIMPDDFVMQLHRF